jgi:SynChlorMet cassette protein ScmC
LGWRFFAKGKGSSLLISWFKHAMGMDRHMLKALAVHKTRQIKKMSVSVSRKEIRWKDMPIEHADEVSCLVGPYSTPEKTVFQLTRVSQIVANASEKKGGLLVHGALAEWNGIGVIMAGPGGVGKTTASNRLPHPWCSLSDDNTLIVKSPDGTYWAHPWPTWSQYRQGDMCGSWNVQAAVKLGLICMLRQGKNDLLCPFPVLQIISELVDVSGQASWYLPMEMNRNAIRRINLIRFHNAIEIGNHIPVCRLEISLGGKFWEELEGFLHESKEMAKIKK